MRAVFSLVGLLVVVVVVVMLVAKKQLQAVAPAAAPATAGAAPATVPEQSRAIQHKVLKDINQSLQQGAERAADTKP